MTQEDLARILGVTTRTIRSDIRELESDGYFIHTRGSDQDIGCGLSHKARIIELYLQGETYDAIMRKSRHSAFSVKRYICSFGRLLLLVSHGMEDLKEISRLLCQSEGLTVEYMELYRRYKRGDHWPEVYVELLEQLKALYPSKKNCRGEGSMKVNTRNRYESIPKRSFRNAIIRLLEENYKLVGSHKVIQMIADDIMDLHRGFYPDLEKAGFGKILWRTTKAGSSKPSYGTRVEDYETQSVILLLITDEDIDNRIKSFYSDSDKEGTGNYKKQMERDIEVIARLYKSAAEQNGWLTGAEMSVLLNRSLTTIARYMRIYHETHDDILPSKGIMLDQGSKPSHKGAIIDLYEQGYPEPDIARITNHRIESTSRYIKRYKDIKLLLNKGFNLMEMVRVTGMGRSTVIQYRDLLYLYHPDMKENVQKEVETEVGNG